ncbi:choice-of-anchor D domain-containing protein [Flavobacterium microcysteis]
MFKKRFLAALVFASISGLSFGKSSSMISLSKTNVSTASNAGILVNPIDGSTIFENPYRTLALNMIDCTGGSETFSNIGAAASAYATRTWTGDNGVAWSATDARTDQELTGKAIALRTSTLKNTSTIANGVGTLSFKYKRVFSGNSTLKVFVNGTQYGGDIAVTSDVSATFSFAVNVSGNAVIEIRNSGNRTIVDDLTWSCYSTVAGPEIQLADASGTNRECGNLSVDFGSHAVNQYNDAVFTVKNLGTAALNVTALTLSNSTDFTIISPAIPFTVAPSGSGLVLVRFQGTTAGIKNSTLTVVSNDADEASCVVNLVGTALQPCVAPVITGGDVAVSSITHSSANVAITNAAADAYLAVISTSSTLSAAPANATSYNVGDSLGGGTVAYKGTNATFSLSGLIENTPYHIFIFPYNNTNCTGGPLYYTEASIDEAFSTPVAPCIGGNETFSNLGTASSTYTSRTWTGDNGVTWSATDSRNDQDLTGDAIALRTGILKNTTAVAGGIGTLNFNYKRVFSGDSTLKVFVNGVQYGGDITVSSDTTTAFSHAIDVAGPVTIEIRNSGNRTIIDDLSWNCYTVPNGPELQLSDSELNLKECGNFTIDFGAVLPSTNKNIIFTVENLGNQDLEVSALTLSDAVNYTIVSPTVPFKLVPTSAIEVEVQFNGATLGNKPATLTVVNNDANEGSCVINLKASVQENCVAPTGTAVITSSNVTDTSASVAVSGVTASGYLAIMSTGGGVVNAPVNGTAYQVNDTLGAGKVVYAGTNATFNVTGLIANTNYSIVIYPYNAECIGSPFYASLPTYDEILTTGAPCVGGTETFSNLGSSSSSYANRTWTGNNSITWSASDARTDQDLNGDAIALRTGTLTNTTAITTGIGTLSFNYQRVFTGDSVLKVFVNGVQYGGDIAVTSTATTVYSQAINVSGNATIEIRNSVNRTIIDDVAWTCYSASPRAAATSVKKSTTSLDSEIKLYPNPNNGQFQLDFAGENADITVFDSLGKSILSKKVASQEVIDLGNAQKGIYIIQIKSGNTTVSKKVAVK